MIGPWSDHCLDKGSHVLMWGPESCGRMWGSAAYTHTHQGLWDVVLGVVKGVLLGGSPNEIVVFSKAPINSVKCGAGS